jgi:hypothetical protein
VLRIGERERGVFEGEESDLARTLPLAQQLPLLSFELLKGIGK